LRVADITPQNVLTLRWGYDFSRFKTITSLKVCCDPRTSALVQGPEGQECRHTSLTFSSLAPLTERL
jgi:hypothetical protein